MIELAEKHVPDIRFAGFDGDWENRKLGDVAVFSKGQGYSKSDLAERGTPVILYGSLYTNYRTSIRQVDTFAIEKPNSIFSTGVEVIVPASGESAEDIARASAVEVRGILLGGDLNIITPSIKLDSLFLALAISNGERRNELSKRAQGKSVVHLRNSDLLELTLLYPNKIEQTAIGNFFRNADNLITLQQRKYDKLVTVKKSMLEKMFPKDCADVPEVRFTGFTGAWENRKAAEIFNTVSDKDHVELPVLSASQEYGMIKRADSGININHDKKNEITYKRVLPGQFVIHLRSFQGGFAHARVEGITSPAYTVLDFLEKAQHYDFFWKYILSSKNFIQRLELVTYGIRDGRSISYNDFTNLDFKFPKISEQTAIGNFFRKLDALITLQQRELEKLKTIKKAMLEKMFV